MSVEHLKIVKSAIQDSPFHMACLKTVRLLSLPDWAIGAGFVRNAVWDILHGFEVMTPLDDVDVLYFEPHNLSRERETNIESDLEGFMSSVPWSVRNQARMHLRNEDEPYLSTEDALRHWLETPTCVAIRLEEDDELTVLAPFGLADLVEMRCRPTRSGLRRSNQYHERLKDKDWSSIWRKVRVE